MPHLGLKDYIYCYWQLKTTHILQHEFNYRVVADGCIDIFFDLNAPQESYVMGFCKKYTEFTLEKNFNYVGVRFLPAMFPCIFKVDAAELSNHFEHLSAVTPKTAAFVTGNFTAPLSQRRINELFDGYFMRLLADTVVDPDPRLYNAISVILENFGVLDIERDLDTGISSRQLRRLFEFYIGDTAKTFSKIVRFQNILRAKPSIQSLRQDKLFYDAGYFDQAHFIKDFKNLYGVTPTNAFGR
jgi:AraC-like DNA-binding protein